MNYRKVFDSVLFALIEAALVSATIMFLACRACGAEPTLCTGGGHLERWARGDAARQLRWHGRVTEGTILHEATHILNSALNSQVGGQGCDRVSEGACAFYFWGKNEYILIPKANFTKSDVLPLIPTDCVLVIGGRATNVDVYFGRMFSARDATHILEDLDAETNGFESGSPYLLRDMVIFASALGMECENRRHPRFAEFLDGDRYMIERACRNPLDFNAFRSSRDGRAVRLRQFLGRAYGTNWTKSVMGFE